MCDVRPVLRTVKDTRNLNGAGLDLIDNDARQGRKGKFAPSGQTTAGPSKIWEVFEASSLVEDRSGNAAGSFGIVPFNPFADLLQILRGWHGPANLHQGCKNRSRR